MDCGCFDIILVFMLILLNGYGWSHCEEKELKLKMGMYLQIVASGNPWAPDLPHASLGSTTQWTLTEPLTQLSHFP